METTTDIKIELVMHQNLKGETWYHIEKNGLSQVATDDLKEAEELLDKVTKLVADGFPKRTILKQNIIEILD